MERIVSNKGMYYWTLLIMMVWGMHPILGYVFAVFFKIPFLSAFSPYVIPSLFIFVLFASIDYWTKSISKVDIAVFIIFETIAFFSLLFYPENEDFTKIAYSLVITTIPCYLIGANLDINRCIRPFYYISVVSIILQAAYLLLYSGRSELEEDSEDMLLSYQLLPHVIMVTWQAMKKTNTINLTISALGSFLLLALGTRGSIICLLGFVILYYFFVKIETSFLFNIFIIIISLVLYTNLDLLTITLNMLISKAGLSNRIMNYFVEGAFMDDSGRSSIQDALLSAMDMAPAFGYGLAGDRNITNGSYAHNLFLELIVSFGWVGGIAISLLIVTIIIRAYYCLKSKTEKGFFFLLFSCGFIHLMISGSFLHSSFFFLLIGYCSLLISRSNNI